MTLLGRLRRPELPSGQACAIDADAVPSAPRQWLTTSIARPVRDLARSADFYRDLLGLQSRGGFAGHDGYDGAFFALPGGAELELATSATTASPGTDEDLLVLYLPTPEEVRRIGAELDRAGAPCRQAPNPYWNRWGQTFLDPDS